MSAPFHSPSSMTAGGASIDYHQELLASLSRINLYNPPVQTCSTGWSFCGFYSGPTSIAYLFHRLSSIYPDLLFKHQTLLEWAEAYLQLSAHVRKPPPTSSHCGIANETLAYTALSAVLNDDASLVKQLCDYSHSINSVDEDGSNEWLYGRAGYLYFLRMCRAHFRTQQHNIVTTITTTVDKTIARMLEVHQPWVWHGKEYIGAAHGSVGIICQIVLSDPAQASQLCSRLLSSILSLQFDSGNFPAAISSDGDELVQFCHGAPGFVLALKSIGEHLSASRMDQLQAQVEEVIQLAHRDITARGCLKKAPCLCHGVVGNFLALDDGQDAERFLAYATSDMLETTPEWVAKAGQSDDFVGLYTGEAGRAWVWAVADKKLTKSCIGFNDL